MKIRNVQDHKKNWVQTVGSIVALVFTILVALGKLTPEQSAEASPLVTSILGAVSTIIAGVVALWALLFKKSTPVV